MSAHVVLSGGREKAEGRSVRATHHPCGPNPGLKAYFLASPFFLPSEPLAFYNI